MALKRLGSYGWRTRHQILNSKAEATVLYCTVLYVLYVLKTQDRRYCAVRTVLYTVQAMTLEIFRCLGYSARLQNEGSHSQLKNRVLQYCTVQYVLLLTSEPRRIFATNTVLQYCAVQDCSSTYSYNIRWSTLDFHFVWLVILIGWLVV
jgi:hypothetical protein